jgi:hypothetical protein
MPIEPAFNTSFIPKKSLQSQVGGAGPYVKRRGTYGPGFFVASLIFALALLVSAGLFFYSGAIERSIEGKIKQLEMAREALRPDLIAAFEYLDMRLATAKSVVGEHRATSALLEHLEAITLTDVRYDKLTYTVPVRADAINASRRTDPSQSQLRVLLQGHADTVESVALQIEQYRVSEFFSEATFQSIDRDIAESPETDFQVMLTIDPRLVAFAEVLERTGAPSVVSAPEPAPTEVMPTEAIPEDATGTSTPPSEVAPPAPEQGTNS